MHSAPIAARTFPMGLAENSTQPDFPEFRTHTVSASMADFSDPNGRAVVIDVSGAYVFW